MGAKSYYHIHNCLPRVSILSQMNLGHTILLVLSSILILSYNRVILHVEYHLRSQRTLSQMNLGHATPTYWF